jgi:hypothetical protein
LKTLKKLSHSPKFASGVEMVSYSRSAKPAILWMVQMGKLLNEHKKMKVEREKCGDI